MATEEELLDYEDHEEEVVGKAEEQKGAQK